MYVLFAEVEPERDGVVSAGEGVMGDKRRALEGADDARLEGFVIERWLDLRDPRLAHAVHVELEGEPPLVRVAAVG